MLTHRNRCRGSPHLTCICEATSMSPWLSTRAMTSSPSDILHTFIPNCSFFLSLPLLLNLFPVLLIANLTSYFHLTLISIPSLFPGLTFSTKIHSGLLDHEANTSLPLGDPPSSCFLPHPVKAALHSRPPKRPCQLHPDTDRKTEQDKVKKPQG